MRPLLAILVAVVILGGLQAYMRWRPRPQTTRVDPVTRIAGGNFDLEVALTFAAGPDPFALDLDAAESVVITLAGRDLLRETSPIAAGETLRVRDIKGIVAGPNEFHVRAFAQQENADLIRGLRVRLLRDNLPIAEQSLWSEPGQPVEGAILVDVRGESAADDHKPQDGNHDQTVHHRPGNQVAFK